MRHDYLVLLCLFITLRSGLLNKLQTIQSSLTALSLNRSKNSNALQGCVASSHFCFSCNVFATLSFVILSHSHLRLAAPDSAYSSSSCSLAVVCCTFGVELLGSQLANTNGGSFFLLIEVPLV